MLRNLNASSAGRRILGTPNVGLLASQIISETATGDNGAGLLYDEALAHAGQQLRVKVTGYTGTPGKLFVYENGSLLITGEADGSYAIAYNWYANNVLGGSDAATVQIGPLSAVALGASLAGSSTLIPGAASGQGDAAAPGVSLTGSATLTPGAASGTDAGTAPGATLNGAGVLVPGSALGNQAATAPGATLTGNATLSPGSATDGTVIYTDAPSGSGPRINRLKTARPANTGGQRI